MADEQRTVLSVVITEKEISDIPISSESQLTFVKNKAMICLDYLGKRYFYNQITNLQSDSERQMIEPLNGSYYFVTETCIFWGYDNDEWFSVTGNTQNTVYIGVSKPETGISGMLYVDKSEQNVSVWDDEGYVVVGKNYEVASEQEINDLFSE